MLSQFFSMTRLDFVSVKTPTSCTKVDAVWHYMVQHMYIFNNVQKRQNKVQHIKIIYREVTHRNHRHVNKVLHSQFYTLSHRTPPD